MTGEMLKRVANAILEIASVADDCLANEDEVARAVIAAMREPTKTMVDVGEIAAGGTEVGNSGCEIGASWRAMIDEALKP